jgi:phage shock protein PspC (stress-responsive transcriptional regulator)
MARRFYRIHAGKKIAGVCTGLAAYFGLDVTLVRVLFIVLAFGAGSAILAYCILWIAAPEAPYEGSEPPPTDPGKA